MRCGRCLAFFGVRTSGIACFAGTVLSALALAASPGCGEGSGVINPNADSGTGAGASAGTGGSPGEGGLEGGGGGNTCNAAIPTNAQFCAAETAKADCSKMTPTRTVLDCGVFVMNPTSGDLTRTNDTQEFAGSGPVDLSCFDPATYPKAGTPKTVTMEGRAKIFSNGCDSRDLKIEVHKVVRSPGTPDDGKVGDLIGTPVSTSTSSPAVDDVFSGKCPANRVLRKFSYPGVPTETELVIVTTAASQPALWATLYDYNVFIANTDANLKGDVWTHDVRALASDDFTTIPSAAMGTPIPAGNGAVAGEVHDCGDVRLGHAYADVDRARQVLVYMSEEEQGPLPDLTRNSIGTGKLGLYAALNLTPGPVTMAAVGTVGGKLVSLGYFKAQVYPNAVSVVTLRGLRPFQL